MPTYTFECKKCRVERDEVVPMSAVSGFVARCDRGHVMERVFRAPGVIQDSYQEGPVRLPAVMDPGGDPRKRVVVDGRSAHRRVVQESNSRNNLGMRWD